MSLLDLVSTARTTHGRIDNHTQFLIRNIDAPVRLKISFLCDLVSAAMLTFRQTNTTSYTYIFMRGCIYKTCAFATRSRLPSWHDMTQTDRHNLLHFKINPPVHLKCTYLWNSVWAAKLTCWQTEGHNLLHSYINALLAQVHLKSTCRWDSVLAAKLTCAINMIYMYDDSRKEKEEDGGRWRRWLSWR